MYEGHGVRLCQGGLLRDLKLLERVELVKGADGEDELKVVETSLPYAIMLSQDCDLEWDHGFRAKTPIQNHDKFLTAMLVSPAYPAGQVRLGTHLEAEGMKMQALNSALWNPITTNNNERYHYLAADPALNLPELVLDFKRYRTVPRETLMECMANGHAIAALKPLFRERLSQRFANYLSRIGLPEALPPAAPSVVATVAIPA